MTASTSQKKQQFLDHFGMYDWGTIQNHPEVFVAGPLSQDLALQLANKVHDVMKQSYTNDNVRYCGTFKGPVQKGSPDRYYVTVPKDKIIAYFIPVVDDSASSSSTTAASTSALAPEIRTTVTDNSSHQPFPNLSSEHLSAAQNRPRKTSGKRLPVKSTTYRNLVNVNLTKSYNSKEASTSALATKIQPNVNGPYQLIQNLLLEHPIIALNEHRRTGEKPIEQKFKENFDAAQVDNNKGANPHWDTLEPKDANCFVDYHHPAPFSSNGILHRMGTAFSWGGRTYMEDHYHAAAFYFVHEERQFVIPYYIVLDGHSAMVDQNNRPTAPIGVYYAKTVETELRRLMHHSLKTITENAHLTTPKQRTEALYDAIKLAFTQASRIAHQRLSGPESPEAGTTATVAFIYNGELFTACAGDSRAILSTPESVIALSKDAKLVLPPSFRHSTETHLPFFPQAAAEIPSESRSVYNRGPHIFSEKGLINRVASGLAVSRSLGHAEIPHERNPAGINPRPTITKIPMGTYAPKHHFVIMASDGLWDKASSEDVSRTVQHLAVQGMRCDDIAKHLVEKAYAAGSHDNITVIVIDLEQPSEEEPKAKKSRVEEVQSSQPSQPKLANSLECDEEDNLSPSPPFVKDKKD